MVESKFSLDQARRYYDLWGARYDWFTFYEARSKSCALGKLLLEPGLWVLNVGIGTGKEHTIIQQGIAPDGKAFGLDISRRMLSVAEQRTKAPLCEADAGHLPFADGSFDRLFCAYVLDLVSVNQVPFWLMEFRRVLRAGGRMVTVNLTEGVNWPSRSFVWIWKLAYSISPVTCGGCQPLLIADLIREAGFLDIQREVVVQLGIPSEVITAGL